MNISVWFSWYGFVDKVNPVVDPSPESCCIALSPVPIALNHAITWSKSAFAAELTNVTEVPVDAV